MPRRFEGIRLDVPAQIAVAGYPPIAIELYHGGAAGLGGRADAGIVVADRLADVAALELARPPWTDPALSGTIEFAALAVPPGTRRGVIPDAAADALANALEQLAPHVQAQLDRQLAQRHATSERQLLGELRRALRGLRERLPHLGITTPLPGRGGAGADRSSDPLGATPGGTAARGPAPEPAPIDDGKPEGAIEPTLLPPGPAAQIRISPDPIRLWPGGARTVRARVFDIPGQHIDAATTWSASSAQVSIEELTRRVIRLAELAEPCRLSITVIAEANGGATSTTVEIDVVDGVRRSGGPGTGIPEPILIDQPTLSWRSRILPRAGRSTSAIQTIAPLGGEPRARLRYMVALFAKDVTVATTHPANESDRVGDRRDRAGRAEHVATCAVIRPA